MELTEAVAAAADDQELQRPAPRSGGRRPAGGGRPPGPVGREHPGAGVRGPRRGRIRPRPFWDATTDEAWRSGSRRFAGLSRAPVVVLPFADPDAYLARYREPDKVRGDGEEVEWVVPYWYVDAAFSIMTLLLGAAEAGIGAAFLGNFRGEDELHAALGRARPVPLARGRPVGRGGRARSAVVLGPPTPPHRRRQRAPGSLVAGRR